MKKIVILILVMAVSITLAGCQKQEGNAKNFEMTSTEIQSEVSGWTVYTNPQYRYELRYPKRWISYSVDEGGDDVCLMPDGSTLSDEYFGEVVIKGHVNWQENYTLEQYYQTQENNLFEQGFEKQEVNLKAGKGIWFKDVTTLYAGKTVDVIAFDMGDRLVEYIILDNWQTAKTILNSMYFYGNKSINVDMEEVEKTGGVDVEVQSDGNVNVIIEE